MSKKKIIIIIFLLTVFLFLFFQKNSLSAVSNINFLNVGQGDAILLRKDNFDLLIDSGPDNSVLLELGKVLPVSDRKIDILMWTHPEQDHIGGISEILDRFEVGVVVMPEVSKKTKQYVNILNDIKRKNIKYVFATAGQIIKYKEIKITILAPDEKLLKWGKTKVNAAAITAKIEMPKYSLLLTGDIEAPTEAYLVGKYNKLLRSDVLKIAHHGSKTSTSVGLLNAVKPSVAIISVGAKNNFGHPSTEILQRLKDLKIFRTDKNGTITFKGGEKMSEPSVKCVYGCR